MVSLLLNNRWRMAAALLAIAGVLPAAPNKHAAARNAGDKAVDKSSINYNIPLWEKGKVPLAKGDGPLDSPFLTVFLPPEGRANGGSVVIAPGGSNIMLMYGVEGMDVAERYNTWGVTAFVLTYRLSPRYGENVRIMEGKRAVQLVRSRAAEFKLDPKRVGYIGFSAGSNTARSVAASSGPGDPNAADPVDRMSSRPDYLVLVYGPGRATPSESLKSFPPTFLVSAAADRGPALGNAQLFADLVRAGTTAEIHVYQKGRHGFGSGFGSPEFSDWMGRLKLFLTLDGFLPETAEMSGSTSSQLMVPLVAPALTSLHAGSSRVVNDGHGDYVYVPAGPFRMGDNFGDGDPRERPVHMVDLDAFYIAQYEMTNGEWKKFRDDPGYDDPKYWPGERVVPKDQSPYWNDARNHGGGTPDGDDYPVLGVNWDEAVAYCNWLSAKTGKKYRLPTEAEWEKAARGTDQRRYPWGNNIDHSYANYVGSQSFDTGRLVGFYDGSKRGDFETHSNASPYGAFDMAGNVMEWCSDWYSRDYYSVSPRKNPTGPAQGAYRVLRGGTFFMEPFELRSYARTAAWPSFQAHRMVGFRAVREP